MADTLRQQLDSLPSDQLAYVHERSKALNAKNAYEAAGISKSKFYGWDEDTRENLDELASDLRANRVLMAEPALNDAIEDALHVVVDLMNHAGSENVRFRAAQEILNRTLGRPTEHHEHTGADGGPLKGYVAFNPEDWDADDDDE